MKGNWHCLRIISTRCSLILMTYQWMEIQIAEVAEKSKRVKYHQVVVSVPFNSLFMCKLICQSCGTNRHTHGVNLDCILGSDSCSHRPAARNYNSTFSSVRSKPNGLSSAMADTTTAVGKRTLTGHTKSTVQNGISSSVGAFSHKTNTSVELSTIAGQKAKPLDPVKTKKAKAVAIFNPMLIKLPSRREAGRGRGVSDDTIDSSRVTDSPEADSHALRKRPGQSIFKAPGHQQQNSG